MSDTPRTDDRTEFYADYGCDFVVADFARQLERELVAERKEKTCGTCKHRGKPIINTDWDEGIETDTGYFLCERVKQVKRQKEIVKGFSAFVVDGSGYYAALCVETDFGCVKWEGK